MQADPGVGQGRPFGADSRAGRKRHPNRQHYYRCDLNDAADPDTKGHKHRAFACASIPCAHIHPVWPESPQNSKAKSAFSERRMALDRLSEIDA
jgi:hypothetical protein